MGHVSARSTLVLICTSAMLCACASESSTDADRPLSPADFASTQSVSPSVSREPVPSQASSVAPPTPASTAPTTTSSPSSNASAKPPAASDGDAQVERALARMPKPVIVASNSSDTTIYIVDAMVGQVNGRAVYASTVLEPVAEQMAALGRTMPRGVFRERAATLISSRLDQIVADALILGQAERDLNAQEQQGLAGMISERRDELLRQYGRGSVSLANETMLEQTGKDLEQTLSEFRQKALVRRYLQQKLFPKLVVSRKDIERYYNDRPDEFNPKPGRTLRLIRVNEEAGATRIEQQLAQKKPFAEVAADRANLYRREQGGLMADKARGEKVFTQDELNAAMVSLQPGQASQRIKIGNTSWWLYVEAIESGKARTLREAQQEIEELLKKQRFQALTQRYRQQLFAEGSYNPIAEMTESQIGRAHV